MGWINRSRALRLLQMFITDLKLQKVWKKDKLWNNLVKSCSTFVHMHLQNCDGHDKFTCPWPGVILEIDTIIFLFDWHLRWVSIPWVDILSAPLSTIMLIHVLIHWHIIRLTGELVSFTLYFIRHSNVGFIHFIHDDKN